MEERLWDSFPLGLRYVFSGQHGLDLTSRSATVSHLVSLEGWAWCMVNRPQTLFSGVSSLFVTFGNGHELSLCHGQEIPTIRSHAVTCPDALYLSPRPL